MVSNKCKHCEKEVELIYCQKCMDDERMSRIFETKEDVASLVYWKVYPELAERIDELEKKIETLLKDKQIVCIRRGGKLVKV